MAQVSINLPRIQFAANLSGVEGLLDYAVLGVALGFVSSPLSLVLLG